MRVPVLPVPSATLAQLPGILTFIHGRVNNTVVFSLALYHTALATASGTIRHHNRWIIRMVLPSCTPATLHARRWRALWDGVAMCSNGNGTWDQRSATNTATSGFAERNLMFANSAKTTVIPP